MPPARLRRAGTLSSVKSWLRKKGWSGCCRSENRERSRSAVGDRICEVPPPRRSARRSSQTGVRDRRSASLAIRRHRLTTSKEMALSQGGCEESLAAVVMQGSRSKLYLAATSWARSHQTIIFDSRLVALEEELRFGPPWMRSFKENSETSYQTTELSVTVELFTHRQLVVLFHAGQAHSAALMPRCSLKGITEDRARALATYFAMAFGRIANSHSTKYSSLASPQDQKTIRERWAIDKPLKMIYDFSEINGRSRVRQDVCPFAFENERFTAYANLRRSMQPNGQWRAAMPKNYFYARRNL